MPANDTGGVLELDEDITTGLRREALEETGLEVETVARPPSDRRSRWLAAFAACLPASSAPPGAGLRGVLRPLNRQRSSLLRKPMARASSSVGADAPVAYRRAVSLSVTWALLVLLGVAVLAAGKLVT